MNTSIVPARRVASSLAIAAAAAALALPSAHSAPISGLSSPGLTASSVSLPSVTYLRSLATGFALDSNYNGDVYAIPSNNGGFQRWIVGPGAYGGVTLRNWQTGRCLDSNTARKVYTLPCNGGSFQSWALEQSRYGTLILRDVATGFVLDGNAAHSVYTGPWNGGSYQSWMPAGA
ncbi:RICIN domain-containing protein [Terrabacter sp. Ter38]|uniref:RICIN domain-containing protein n=1 Tax=Terrabacter sp. Ter38 TaxID=2926030 RepID=UPI0035B3EBF7